MKPRHPLFLVTLLFFTALIFGAGCSSPPNPMDKARAYVNAWNKQDFPAMYQMLTPEAKGSISRDTFIKRYKTIYNGIEASKLKVTLDSSDSKENPKKLTHKTIQYDISMQTIAGPLHYTGNLTLDKSTTKKDQQGTWGVNWNPSLIIE